MYGELTLCSVCITSIIRLKSLYEISVSTDTSSKNKRPFIYSEQWLIVHSGWSERSSLVLDRNQCRYNMRFLTSNQTTHQQTPTQPIGEREKRIEAHA